MVCWLQCPVPTSHSDVTTTSHVILRLSNKAELVPPTFRLFRVFRGPILNRYRLRADGGGLSRNDSQHCPLNTPNTRKCRVEMSGSRNLQWDHFLVIRFGTKLNRSAPSLFRVLSGLNSEWTRLRRLDENADERTIGRRGGSKITHETSCSSEFNMPGSTPAIHQNRTNRCAKRILN